MSLFLAKRFLTLVATLIGTSVIVFLVLDILPGNAAQILMGPDASPEAVDSLRWVRRHDKTGERVTVSALDPVNLAGIVVPGAKVSAQPGKFILYVDGLPQELPASATEKTPVPSKLTPRLPARAG